MATNDLPAIKAKRGRVHKRRYQVFFLKTKKIKNHKPMTTTIYQIRKKAETPKVVAIPFPPLNFK